MPIDRPPSRRPDRRDFGPGPYIRNVRVNPRRQPLPRGYPFLPVIHDLARLELSPTVTILTGENGAGKSTLVEALAIAAGFKPAGGPLSAELGGDWASEEERVVADALEITHGRCRPRTGFFLRAESFLNVAAVIDERKLSEVYGGRELNAQSHGESFLALAANRFGGDGLFIFDEPEAALSVTSQLAFIAILQRAVSLGSQFIFATHSPILLSYPGASLYLASETGLERVEPEQTDAVALTRSFLDAPERFLRHLAPDET